MCRSPAPAPPGSATQVNATIKIVPGFGGAYDGSFVIVNNANYSILSWSLSFTFSGGAFSWGPSDVDLTYSGTTVSRVDGEVW